MVEHREAPLRRWALSAVLVAAAACGSVPVASAVTYEPAPAFCQRTVVHDYLAPFQRMPELHSPPVSGRVGFGPTRLVLKPLSPLLVGEGEVGYSLGRIGTAPVHLTWNVTTTLSRVDWKGRVVEVLERAQRRVTTIGQKHGAGVKFEVGDDPTIYRVTTVFRNQAERKLGGYGFYFRVVAPTQRARLALNAGAYRPGQTVFARVENFGTETAFYGVPYSIERLEGTAWVKALESPSGPWIMPLLVSGPGLSENCNGFWIRPTMAPGRYRIVKEVEFSGPRFSRLSPASSGTPLTAEFDVLP